MDETAYRSLFTLLDISGLGTCPTVNTYLFLLELCLVGKSVNEGIDILLEGISLNLTALAPYLILLFSHFQIHLLNAVLPGAFECTGRSVSELRSLLDNEMKNSVPHTISVPTLFYYSFLHGNDREEMKEIMNQWFTRKHNDMQLLITTGGIPYTKRIQEVKDYLGIQNMDVSHFFHVINDHCTDRFLSMEDFLQVYSIAELSWIVLEPLLLHWALSG